MSLPSLSDAGDADLAYRISDGVVFHTFGATTALDRLKRFIGPAYSDQKRYAVDCILSSFEISHIPGSPIYFWAYAALKVQEADTTMVELKLLSMPMPCCTIDIIAVDPLCIIPSRLFVPYSGSQRSETVLKRTDMLPIFFKRIDGGVGVPIATDGDYMNMQDSPTRISASSIEVVLNLLNYHDFERQIRPRLPSMRNDRVSARRLARLVAAKVRECLNCAERQNASITHWESMRWRFGTGEGYIGIPDVRLLGIIFVSPGKITPLLEVRPDFFFAH